MLASLSEPLNQDEPVALAVSLRRLVLEFSNEDLSKILGEYLLGIDTLETLAILRDSPEEVAVLCRVTLKDRFSKVRKSLPSSAQLQVLEKEGGNAYTVFFRLRHPKPLVKLRAKNVGAYLSMPYEIADGKTRATFLGTLAQTRELLRILAKAGIWYKVVSTGDARIPHDSPLARLTDKQRKVLVTAYNLGYYDLPKRTCTRELAERLRMRSSTLVIHRIKAEKRILDGLLH